jgi:hypothetical protein
MSIDSLITNVQILDEIEQYIETKLTPTAPGITSIISPDGNMDINTQNNICNLNLKDTISVNTFDINTLKSPNINFPGNLNISLDDNVNFKLDDTTIQFNNGSSNFTFDNSGNFTLNNCSLLTHSMNNPFASLGSSGQLLQTDGNNNLSWVNPSIAPTTGRMKYIDCQVSNTAEFQQGNPLTIFNQVYNNFTPGKTTVVELYHTYYVASNGLFNTTIQVELNSKTSSSYINIPNDHTYFGLVQSFPNTGTSQLINITITGQNLIYKDGNDYLCILIYEIQ